MVAAVEGNEPCLWDLGGDDSSFLRWRDAVPVTMKDDGRHFNFGQERANVDLVTGAHEADEVLR